MKKIFAAIALMGFASIASAQATQSSVLDATSTLNSTSGASNQGVRAENNFYSDNSGTTTVRTTPSMGMGSYSNSFSSDYCAGSAQAALSVVGTGIGGGGPVVDLDCSKRRNFERLQQAAATAQTDALRGRLQQASIDVLCSTDADTRAAMEGQGLCTAKTMEVIDQRNIRQAGRNQGSLYSGS